MAYTLKSVSSLSLQAGPHATVFGWHQISSMANHRPEMVGRTAAHFPQVKPVLSLQDQAL